METSALLDAHVQLKRIYHALNETFDISRQLAEAMDRNDQIAIQMLVAMRQEPVEKLTQARQALEHQRDSLPPGVRARLSELLNGAPAKEAAEEGLANQVGVNNRLLKQLVELDRILNRKLTREKSIYQ